MIAVLQRINRATVYADGEFCSAVEKGLYILLGVEQSDSTEDAELLANKIAKLRIFCDNNDKLNLSVNDIGGEIMVVSNFTLSANYSHGNRPDFFTAAAPTVANELYEFFILKMREFVPVVKSGSFGADMRTELSTDGPVTIVMNSSLLRRKK